jgi:hypothetical protein
MKKWLYVGGIGAMFVGSTIGAVIFMPKAAKADLDLPGLNQQVQNHEARIANTEKDVEELQKSTGTAPAPDKQSVPPAPTPSTTATPTSTEPVVEPQLTPPPPPPAPTVVSTSKECRERGQEFLVTEYSDGTSKAEPTRGWCQTGSHFQL